jgi:predicted TIM-barrel fold metal-dependent hydrolase
MSPVIDVHAHVFRGRDIPLKGYLLSRAYPEWYIRLFAPILFGILERAICADGRGLISNFVKNLAVTYMGEGYRRWADTLSLKDMGVVTAKLIRTYRKDGIELSIPLMIDFEYWFKPTGMVPIVEQIDAMYRDVVLPYKGRVHPFVPFDPARELAHRAKLPGPGVPDGGPREKYSSLDMAKEAIRNKGFIGVKVYNTLGYRPLGNAAVDKQRRGIFNRNGMRRYSAFTGEQFDEVLSELYRFCEREQVPITAHCVYNGIEAYPRASFDFADPEYWRPVLEKFPGLHVNLAHFGWDKPEEYLPPSRWKRFLQTLREAGEASVSWLGMFEFEGRKQTWVREIAQMLSEFPNLYADVSHNSVTEDSNLPKFRAAYAAMIRDHPGVIQRKLLFGIDWHTIERVENYTTFMQRYRQVLQGGSIFNDAQIQDFLGGNTLRFLGLLPPSERDATRWSKNWMRLKSFYRKNRIRPPKWFRDASMDGEE